MEAHLMEAPLECCLMEVHFDGGAVDGGTIFVGVIGGMLDGVTLDGSTIVGGSIGGRLDRGPLVGQHWRSRH